MRKLGLGLLSVGIVKVSSTTVRLRVSGVSYSVRVSISLQQLIQYGGNCFGFTIIEYQQLQMDPRDAMPCAYRSVKVR